MRNSIIAFAILILTACEGAPGTRLSDPALAVISGANQVHPAAEADSLDAPVVTQVYRTPEGGITFHVVPRAYAQSAARVGVSNVQVCAVPVGNDGLQPWVPCDITDQEGLTRFFFEPGTKAGTHCAEIRGVVDGRKEVAEQVCATVEPGPVSRVLVFNRLPNLAPGEVAWFDHRSFVDDYENEIPWTLEADGFTVEHNTTFHGIVVPEGQQGGTLRFLREGTKELLLEAKVSMEPSNLEGRWTLNIEF